MMLNKITLKISCFLIVAIIFLIISYELLSLALFLIVGFLFIIITYYILIYLLSDISIMQDKLDASKSDFQNDQIKLNDLEQVRSRFLANVSHELKTPIFTIKGYAETLLDGALEDENVNSDFIKKIHHQSIRLENLFSDLINISRIESNELVLNIQEIRLDKIITWLEGYYREKIQDKGLNFIIPDCDDITVKVDEKHIKSVFTNLLDNAITYSEKGNIIISVKNKKDMVTISVTDNGVGIKDEHLEKIFNRFYRVDEARSRDSGGTGLGLAIVKHIIEAHGSKVLVTSIMGQGTTFTFDIAKA